MLTIWTSGFAMTLSQLFSRKDERAVWLKHDLASPTGGQDKQKISYFRPSYTRNSNVFCLGATVRSAPPGEARYQECTPDPVHSWVVSEVGARTVSFFLPAMSKMC